MNDPHSRRILEALLKDSRQTVQQISERVGLSTTPCWKRIKDLESRGIVTGYTVRIDRKKVGLNLMVIAQVNLGQHTEKMIAAFEAAVAAMPQVVGCYSTTGRADYVLTVLVSDVDHYEQWLNRQLFKLPGVTHVHSNIVLREVKSDVPLPV